MSRENSLNYAQGAADALRDNELEAHGETPIGPKPPPKYNRMYIYGYQEHREMDRGVERNGARMATKKARKDT